MPGHRTPTLGGIADRSRPDHFPRRIKDLEDEVRKLRTARSAAGGVGIPDGGAVVARDAVGDPIVTLGTLGDGTLGIVVKRPDGTRMFSSSVLPGIGSQTLIRDVTGATAVADDVAGGLARPYLAMGPMVDASPQGVTPTPPVDATWVTVQTAACVRSHPRVRWDAILSSSDGATSGSARLVDANGVQIGPTVSIPGPSVAYVTVGPVPWPAGTWTPGDLMYLSVQTQLLSGAGTIGARTTGLHGVSST